MSNIIRFATSDDLEELVDLVMDEAIELEVGDPDIDTCLENMERFLNSPEQYVIVVAETDGELVGVTGFIVGPEIFNKNRLVATQMFWFVTRKYRKGLGGQLLDSALKYLEPKVKAIRLTTSGKYSKAVGRHYTNRGYEPFEYIYNKEN
jgi:GNAT superfamily N-acetyltransferase